MYVHVCAHVFVYVYMYMYMFECIYMCVYVHMHVFSVCTCASVYLVVCMCTDGVYRWCCSLLLIYQLLWESCRI